ncbi:MAG: CsbD family protein [Ardenticatenales bacterium]|nr:CsbD family protein [Ardenticatenales bacterium]
MEKVIFAQQWKPMRAHFREWWVNLTEADLDRVSGNLDRFLILLQVKCGYTRAQAEAELGRRVAAHEAN